MVQPLEDEIVDIRRALTYATGMHLCMSLYEVSPGVIAHCTLDVEHSGSHGRAPRRVDVPQATRG